MEALGEYLGLREVGGRIDLPERRPKGPQQLAAVIGQPFVHPCAIPRRAYSRLAADQSRLADFLQRQQAEMVGEVWRRRLVEKPCGGVEKIPRVSMARSPLLIALAPGNGFPP